MSGYEFLKDLCHNMGSEKKTEKRPLSSAFRGISRDKSLVYVSYFFSYTEIECEKGWTSLW